MDVVVNGNLGFQNFSIRGCIIFNLGNFFVKFFVVDSLGPPNSEAEYRVLDHLCKVEGPLDIALDEME